jgi:excisionase family DNA binding protein
VNEARIDERCAAKYLGISLSTIKRMRYEGEIAHYRIGRRIRYSKEKHLDTFLKRCEQTDMNSLTEMHH